MNNSDKTCGKCKKVVGIKGRMRSHTVSTMLSRLSDHEELAEPIEVSLEICDECYKALTAAPAVSFGCHSRGD